MNLSLSSDKEFIAKLSEIVLANLGNENFGVEQLVEQSGLSSSVIRQRLKIISKKTTTQFINEVRLKQALKILQEGDATASVAAYKTGFGSPTYFNKCFHDFYGFPPGEARKRFLNEIESNSSVPDQNQIDAKPAKRLKSKQKVILSISAGFLILAILGFLIYPVVLNYSGKTIFKEKNHEKSIAVLPFKNLSENPDNQYFADGIMEDILNQLNRIDELRVISRTSIEQFRDIDKTTSEIAKELNVNYILEGSVLQYEKKARVFVQLIEVRNDQLLFSEKFDTDLSDIFTIQSYIARQVADKLQATLSIDEIKQLEKIPTRNSEAYILYQKGRFFWNRRTEEGVRKSKEYFEKATMEDPDYALAWAGLADAYFILTWWGWYSPSAEGYEKAKSYAQKAIEIDKNLAEAHTVLGGILNWYNWDWKAAEEELNLAIRLNPNYATAHQYYAELLDILNFDDKAREQIDIAINLEPFSPVKHGISSMLYYNEANFEEALKECHEIKLLEKKYVPAYIYAFKIYYQQKNDSSAINELKLMLQADASTIKYVQEIEKIYDELGVEGLMKWLIEERISYPELIRLNLPSFYALSGNKEKAIECLEKNFTENKNEICRIISNRDLAILHDDPRYLKLVDKMGLTPYFKKNPK